MNIRSTLMCAAGAATLACTVVVGACTHDELLGVNTPDIITPDKAQSVAGAQTFRVSAIGNFARFIGGDLGGSSPLGLNLSGGMLGDEIFSARAGTEHMDNRNINPNTFPIDTWTQVGNTYTRLVRAINLLTKFPPASGLNDQLAELLADAVEGGASVSFMKPFNVAAAREWWKSTLERADPRAIVLVSRDDLGIAGSVSLHPVWPPNQPHRADITITQNPNGHYAFA